jgi:hypothetical protein
MKTKQKSIPNGREKRVAVTDESLSRQLSVRLSSEEYASIIRLARQQGRTASNYIRMALFGGAK